jgi:hypothetical protein
MQRMHERKQDRRHSLFGIVSLVSGKYDAEGHRRHPLAASAQAFAATMATPIHPKIYATSELHEALHIDMA